MTDIGGLGGFSVRQEAALTVCESRKDMAVDSIDAHNAIVDQILEALTPKPFWKRLFGKR